MLFLAPLLFPAAVVECTPAADPRLIPFTLLLGEAERVVASSRAHLRNMIRDIARPYVLVIVDISIRGMERTVIDCVVWVA